jgi:hypothetical protein
MKYKYAKRHYTFSRAPSFTREVVMILSILLVGFLVVMLIFWLFDKA